MSTFIELGLSNAIVAGGLAMFALIVTRCCKNPTLVHGLWALVILKLLTPPLWTLPVADVPVIDHTAQVVATGQLSEAGDQDSAPKHGSDSNPGFTNPRHDNQRQSSSNQRLRAWAFPFKSSNGQDQLPTVGAISTRWSHNSPLERPYYAFTSIKPMWRSGASPGVAGRLRDAVAAASGKELSSPARPAAASDQNLSSSTLSVDGVDIQYWLSKSHDAIEFLAKNEQSPKPPTWERPALDYVVLMTYEGNTLVVPGEEIAQWHDHPLQANAAEAKPPTTTKSGELRTLLAQEMPGPEWSVVWGTRLARLWSNCRTPLAILWGVGSLWCLLLAVVRIRRFHKVLARTEPAPEKLIASARRLAKRIGLRRTPEVRLAPGVSNPLVWRGLRTSYIVLPAELLRQLSRTQAATLLTHELAHLRRNDHVMRWLELAATILYWWNPILWFARRQLRESEERCCDAWVVWAMPQAARDYLDTVLKTVDFLSERKVPLPLAATGMGHFQELRTRFEQVIANHQDRREHNRLSRFARCGLAVVALAMLPLVPTLTAQGIVQANVILQEVPISPDVVPGHNLTVEFQPAVPSAAWSAAEFSQASQLSRSIKNMPGLLATDEDLEAVAASIDGRLLAVGRSSGTVELYQNTASGLEFVWSADAQRGTAHQDKVTSLAFSPNGQSLASVGCDGHVQVRNVVSGEIQNNWQASTSWLTDVAFSPRGDMLAVGGYDKTVQLFDLTHVRDIAGLPASIARGEHASAVRAIAFLPKKPQLATVDSAGNLSLWSLHGNELSLLQRVAAHHGVARDVSVNATGNRLATVGEDGQLRLWSCAADDLAELQSHETDDLLSQVSFGFDDRLLISAGWSGEIHLHDAATGEIIKKVADEPGLPVRNLAVSHHSILLAGGQSAGLSLWGLNQPVATYYVPTTIQLQPINLGITAKYVTTSSRESPAMPRKYYQANSSFRAQNLAPKNIVVVFAPEELANAKSEDPQSPQANDETSPATSTDSSHEQFAPACDEPNPRP